MARSPAEVLRCIHAIDCPDRFATPHPGTADAAANYPRRADLIPLDGVREWLQGAGDAAQLIVLPGSDHAFFLDQPDAVFNAIDEFLQRGQFGPKHVFAATTTLGSDCSRSAVNCSW